MERAGASTLGRVIACALLVIGIAVMHHVVVTGCSTLTSSAGQGHAAQGHAAQDHVSHAPASLDASSADAAVADGLGEVPPAQSPAAAICLAIVLGGWLMVPLVRAWRIRRDTEQTSHTRDRAIVDIPARPPDLVLLSVSRT